MGRPAPQSLVAICFMFFMFFTGFWLPQICSYLFRSVSGRVSIEIHCEACLHPCVLEGAHCQTDQSHAENISEQIGTDRVEPKPCKKKQKNKKKNRSPEDFGLAVGWPAPQSYLAICSLCLFFMFLRDFGSTRSVPICSDLFPAWF